MKIKMDGANVSSAAVVIAWGQPCVNFHSENVISFTIKGRQVQMWSGGRGHDDSEREKERRRKRKGKEKNEP